MLPKPEKGKTKKLNNNFLSDSEITKESEEVINAKKVKNKRKVILISLIATAGLSLIFWSVKGIQSFTSSPHPLNLNLHFDFKLPEFNLKNNPKPNNSTSISSASLDEFLSNKNLSALIFKDDNFSNPLYQYNFPNFDITNFISELSQVKSSETSNIITNLPEGLLFQEKLENSLYGLIIKLPQKTLTIIIKNNDHLDNFSQNISDFIGQAYWYSVAQQ